MLLLFPVLLLLLKFRLVDGSLKIHKVTIINNATFFKMQWLLILLCGYRSWEWLKQAFLNLMDAWTLVSEQEQVANVPGLEKSFSERVSSLKTRSKILKLVKNHRGQALLQGAKCKALISDCSFNNMLFIMTSANTGLIKVMRLSLKTRYEQNAVSFTYV